MTEQRRLAAIVSADVAGYSRLMGRDESGTLAALKGMRLEVVDPAVASHAGRIVKSTGDGLLRASHRRDHGIERLNPRPLVINCLPSLQIGVDDRVERARRHASHRGLQARG